MRILFTCRLFYSHVGGVENHVEEICKKLILMGHAITVLCEKHNVQLPEKETFKGIVIYRMPNFKKSFWKKFKIWKWMIQNRYLIVQSDIIHCHDVFFWYLPMRLIFPFKKVYTTFHGYESYPVKMRAIIARKISEILSTKTICIGGFMKKWYFANPTYISYGGVDLNKFKIQNSKFKINKGESAVFIGRLDEQTGVLDYHEAVKLIRKVKPSFRLTVVGDGVYRKRLEKEGVKVIGFDKDVAKYFLKNRFAFVSRYLSILEAMASKRLVFALYDNPIKKDYLQMSPFAKFIVICETPEELVSKILYYLNNIKQEKKLIEKGYKYAKKQTWSTLANKYLKLWDVL